MEADSRAHLMAQAISTQNVPRAFQLSLSGAEAELRHLIIAGQVLPTARREDGLFKGWTLLHAAASKGHADVVTMLLQAGARVSDRNAAGKTATAMASDKGHSAVVAICQAAEAGALAQQQQQQQQQQQPPPPQPQAAAAPPPPPPSSIFSAAPLAAAASGGTGGGGANFEEQLRQLQQTQAKRAAAAAAVALPASFFPQQPLASGAPLLPAAAPSLPPPPLPPHDAAAAVERLLEEHHPSVSNEGRHLAVLPEACLPLVLGPENAKIIEMCERFDAKLDVRTASGFAVLEVYQFQSRRSAEAFVWELLHVIPDGAACGAALPMASGEPSPMPPMPEPSAEVVEAVKRASHARAVIKSNGGLFVSSASAASLHAAMLLLTRDGMGSEACATKEILAFSAYPANMDAIKAECARRAAQAKQPPLPPKLMLLPPRPGVSRGAPKYAFLCAERDAIGADDDALFSMRSLIHQGTLTNPSARQSLHLMRLELEPALAHRASTADASPHLPADYGGGVPGGATAAEVALTKELLAGAALVTISRTAERLYVDQPLDQRAAKRLRAACFANLRARLAEGRQAPHEEALLGLASWLDGAIAIIDAASMGELRRTTSGMHDSPNISPFGPSMAGGHAGGAPLFSFGGGDKGTKRVAEGDAAEEGDGSDEDEDGAGGKRRKSGGGT